MPYSFPLTRSEFLNRLPVMSITIDCPEQVEMSQTGGGEILMADLAPRLWRGKITLGRLTPSEEAEAMALIDVVRGPGRSFAAYDVRRYRPVDDPTGSILGGASPTLLTVGGSSRTLQLQGLPAGYTLRAGDRLSFPYGSNPTRRALHKVVDLVKTADGSGETPYIEVVPNVRPGWSAGAAVDLIRPWCKAVIVPGSVEPGSHRRGLTEGISFSFHQTLR